MKIIKTSVIGHLPGVRKKESPFPSSPLYPLFDELKKMLKPYELSLATKTDNDLQYELWTKHQFRTSSFHPTGKQGVLFAAVVIYMKHVSLYFYPIYANKSLKEELPESLFIRLKGKSCFHFTELTDDQRSDLTNLLKSGWDFYKEQGWVPS